MYNWIKFLDNWNKNIRNQLYSGIKLQGGNFHVDEELSINSRKRMIFRKDWIPYSWRYWNKSYFTSLNLYIYDLLASEHSVREVEYKT